MDDPIVTMRMQYIEDLEDILQCPVCWEIPDASKAIITCACGHHMCSNCKTTKNINACPTCQSAFNGSRNFLAENLSSKFNDIKESLIDPNHYTNRRIVKKSAYCQTNIEKSSIETQTFINNASVNTQTEEVTENNDTENLIQVILTYLINKVI
ncbi:hypothetical protein TKK_0015757 [Trichogramma kaykai]|uniref:RING-type domain-containing protein n=1 Tax=Trichogramma kaykai TaxID=54128 RepID=A0ABD2W8T2_9HYME